jgi:hypothetical protein
VKKKQKILLISYHFSPSNVAGSLRFSYLSNYLTQNDFKVYVLTIKEKYAINKDIQLPHGGKVFRTSMFLPINLKHQNILTRAYKKFLIRFLPIDSSFGWFLPGLYKAFYVIIKNKISKVIVTGPPFSSFLIAYFVSIILKVELYLDYRDPWFLDWEDNAKFFKTKVSMRWLNLCIEKSILKRAKEIIFNTMLVKKDYLKSFPQYANKSHVINNAYLNTDGLERKYLESDKKVILYAGSFYGERKLNYIYNPLKRIFNEKIFDKDLIRIHVFGEVPKEDKDLLSSLSLESILIEHGIISYVEVLKYMKGADILYLSQGYDHSYCIPYKLIDYLSVKRPILALAPLESSTYEVMKNVDSGEIADISDTESIYHALIRLLAGNNNYSFNGVEKYSWDFATQKYIEVLVR